MIRKRTTRSSASATAIAIATPEPVMIAATRYVLEWFRRCPEPYSRDSRRNSPDVHLFHGIRVRPILLPTRRSGRAMVVADASAIPDIQRANTNLTVAALERIAETI